MSEVTDAVIAAFTAVTVSGVRFINVWETVIGRSEKWWQHNVTCRWWYDDNV